MSRTSFAGDALRGLIAGTAAVYALDKLDRYLKDDQRVSARLQAVTGEPGGNGPAGSVAHRAATELATALAPTGPTPAGMSVRYGTGAVMGAAYSVLRARNGMASIGVGIPYGLAMYVAQEERLNPRAAIGGTPSGAPWQDHARRAVAHGFFGLVTEMLVRVLGGYRPR